MISLILGIQRRCWKKPFDDAFVPGNNKIALSQVDTFLVFIVYYLYVLRPYAYLFTLAEYVFDLYPQVLVNELGFSKDKLWDYFNRTHSTAIKGVHVEQDHAMNNIRLD